MVVSPEHSIIKEFKNKIKNWQEVEKYITASAGKSNIERASSKEKTGIKLEGVFAVNPANGKNIPIFVADYVLIGYGTGAIMAVPAHDQRDWDFAKKYNIEITEVIKGQSSDISKCAYEGRGRNGKFRKIQRNNFCGSKRENACLGGRKRMGKKNN
jgi:leucyl-tRNA synthetase